MVDNLSSQFFWVFILSWYIFSWTNIPFLVPWSSTAWVAFCTLSSVHTLFYGSCGRRTCTWRCISFFNAIPNLQIKIVFILFCPRVPNPMLLFHVVACDLQLEFFSVHSVKIMNLDTWETYKSLNEFLPP